MNLALAIGTIVKFANKAQPNQATGFTLFKSGSLHFASIRIGDETINSPFGSISQDVAICELAIELSNRIGD